MNTAILGHENKCATLKLFMNQMLKGPVHKQSHGIYNAYKSNSHPYFLVVK